MRTFQFPGWVYLPPVSIVVDRLRLHKPISAINVTPNRQGNGICSVCYHKKVVKRSFVSHSRKFIKHVVPEVLRPARTLWHEVIGFLFLALAVWPIPSGIRTIRAYDGSGSMLIHLVLIAVFVGIMGGYGISSFLRARRISRS